MFILFLSKSWLTSFHKVQSCIEEFDSIVKLFFEQKVLFLLVAKLRQTDVTENGSVCRSVGPSLLSHSFRHSALHGVGTSTSAKEKDEEGKKMAFLSYQAKMVFI